MKFYQSSAALLAGLLFTSQIPLMANEQEEPVRLAEQTVDVQTFVDELTGEQDQPVFEQEDGILVQESESLQSEDQSLEESEPLQSEDQNLFEEGEVLLQTNDSQKEQSMETSAPLAPADQPDEPLSMDQDSSTQSAKNGWVEQNGYLFYFDQGKKLTGAQQINGKSYYFSEDGSLGYGFVNNGFYNYKDGSLASGLIFVDGNTYYVLDDGTLAMDQEVWFDGALHYFDGNGQLIKGFFRDDTETAYYSWLDGSRLSGVQFYDDQLYVLGQYGPQNTGLINVNGTEYWQKADGTVARNEFLEIDGINFYFDANGQYATNQLVSSPDGNYFISSDGNIYYGTEAIIRQEAQNVYDLVGTGLYELFYWTVNHIYYVSDTVSDSAEYYALRGFQQGNGNCMAFAATFYYLARFLGYDAQLIRGYVNDPSGVVLNHGWVTINEPDGTWVYDPEGAYELGYRANFYRTSPYSPPINYVYP